MWACGWLLAAACLGAEPAGPPAVADVSPARVAALVEQLNAPQKAAREQAEQALLDLGPAALDHLPHEGDAGADPLPAETAIRLRRIRLALEQRRAESAAAGSRITLPDRELPLAEILAEFERQSGNRVVDMRREFGERPVDAPLRLPLSGVGFWPALDQLLDAAGLTAYHHTAEQAIGVVARPLGQGPRQGRASYSGAFRIEPSTIRAQRDLRNPTHDLLQVELELCWEPRLRPILVRHEFTTLAVTDDQGAAVPARHAESTLERPLGAEATSLAVPLALQLPGRQVRTLARLAGRFDVLLPGRTERFRFAGLDAAELPPQRKASAVVAIDQVRKNNDLWEVHLRVGFDRAAPGAMQSHLGWVLNNAAYLEDAAGKRIDYVGSNMTRQSESETGLTYLFVLDEGVAGHTFVYETPGAVLSAAVPYELRDLPLP